jgi:Flp pilus assembly pilin Flp
LVFGDVSAPAPFPALGIVNTPLVEVRMRFIQFVREFHREESGQDMLEYALVLAAVLTAVVAGNSSLSSTIGSELTNIDTYIAGLKIG